MEVELELILQDAEVTVAKIREELAQHRQLRRQREQIERLPEYLAQTEVRWRDMRILLDEVRNELSEGQQGAGEANGAAGASDGPTADEPTADEPGVDESGAGGADAGSAAESEDGTGRSTS